MPKMATLVATLLRLLPWLARIAVHTFQLSVLAYRQNPTREMSLNDLPNEEN